MLCFSAGLFLRLGLITHGQTFINPDIYEDFPDNDIFLGLDGKTF
jgi:hypothetical protein